LIGDPEAVQALNLQMSSDMRTSQKPYIQQFEKFKKCDLLTLKITHYISVQIWSEG